MYIHLLIVIIAVQILEGIKDNNKASFISLWICPYFMGNVRVYIDKSPTPFIYGYNYKTNKVPNIPLIPTHPTP